MAFTVIHPSPMPAASNLLLRYVGGLASNLGLDLQPGQESAFLSSLQGNGLAADDVRVLARILNGKSVKLHEYRGVVQGMEKLVGSHLAEEAVRDRLEQSEDLRDQVHYQAVRELEDRGLRDDFLDFILMSVVVTLSRGTLSLTDPRDVSVEFRSFVLNRDLQDLANLAEKYVRAAQRVYQDRALLRSVRR